MNIIMDEEWFLNNIVTKLNQNGEITLDLVEIILLSFMHEKKPFYSINDLKKLYAILLENTIFPLNINNCLLVAIKYYIKKYGICTLCDKNNNIILYYK